MKKFIVILKNGRDLLIKALSYHRDSEQYVFIGNNDDEVQFVVAEEVISIYEDPHERGPMFSMSPHR